MHYTIIKNTFLCLVCIVFIVSCATPKQTRKLHPDVLIYQAKNSKPRVVKINPKYRKLRATYLSSNQQYSPRIQKLIQLYGKQASKRIKDWQYTIIDHRRASALKKLNVANSFINRLNFIDDRIHWRKKDYWATPLETLASSGGDCEDFAIAKYYMLTKLGIADQCLTLNYVKVRNYKKPHMVLIYQCPGKNTPIVLDNLNPRLLSVKQRSDLIPVYSFNQTGMWLTNTLGEKQKLSSISKLRRWDEVRLRIKKEQLN
ncbi:MAG: transglutaminase-like cysteine peptidase [Pseudomonadota bacterium]